MTKTFIAAMVGVAVGALGVAVAWGQQQRPAFILAQINIHDVETYSKYGAEFGPIFTRYEGQGVAFSEAPDVLEGEWNFSRTVVLRFKSKKAALAWYNDPDYQRIVKHRWAASDANLILIEGR